MDEVRFRHLDPGTENHFDQTRPRNAGTHRRKDSDKKASSRQVDGITVVDLSGRITLGEGSVVLRDTVRDLLAKVKRGSC